MALALSDIVASTTTPAVFTDTATRTFNLPTSGVSEGMMMVLIACINQASADIGDVLTDPSGWNQAFTEGLPNTASTPRYYVFWRAVPEGGLGSTVDITSSVSNISHGGVAFAVQNCDVTALDVVGTANTGSGTTITCPAVSASATGGLTIRVGCNDDDDQSSQPSMSGHSAIDFVQVGPTVQNGFNVYGWAATQPSTSVGTSTASIANEQWGGQTFVIAEQTGISISDVETTEEIRDEQTNVTITGTQFEASQGSGVVELADNSDYGSAGTIVEQTVTSWGDTSIDFTVDIGGLSPGTVYVFVTNDSAEQNDPGFPVTIDHVAPTAVGAAGVDPTLDVDTIYRAVIRVENAGTEDQDDFKTQYNHNSGGWNDVTGASSVIQAAASAFFADGADVPESLTGTGTYIDDNNAAMESDGALTLAANMPASSAFELHLAFQIIGDDVSDEDTIQLRVVRGDSSVLESYTDIPTITANKQTGVTLILPIVQNYRHMGL